jgi:hypothetical protein
MRGTGAQSNFQQRKQIKEVKPLSEGVLPFRSNGLALPRRWHILSALGLSAAQSLGGCVAKKFKGTILRFFLTFCI